MSGQSQEYQSKLAQAEQELQRAQARIAALEAAQETSQRDARAAGEIDAWGLMDMLSGACEIIDTKWRVAYVNDAAARYSGLAKDEMQGQLITECHPGIEASPLYPILQHCMQARVDYSGEFEFAGDGSGPVWVDIQVHPLPVGLLIRGFDITDRKQAQRRLQASEERLRLFVMHAPAPIAMLDKDMRYIAASRRWFSAYRLDDVDVIGQSHYELFPDLPERWRAAHQLGLAGTPSSADAEPFVHPDGQVDWARWEVQPWYTSDGEVGGIFLLTEDVTRQKEAEAKLAYQSMILSHVHDAVIATDDQFRVTYWNRAAEQMFGWTADEMIGQLGDDLMQSEFHGTTRESAMKDLFAGKSYDLDVSYRCKDGKRLVTQSNAVALTGPHGEFAGMIVSARDITEQKWAEHQVQKLTRTLSVLSDVNQAIVRERDLRKLLNMTCEIAVRRGDFRMAWIGLIDSISHRVTPVARDGVVGDYLDRLALDLSGDMPPPECLEGALQRGERWICNDLEQAATEAPERELALTQGYRACALYPLRVSGETRGVFGLYTADAQFFDEDELRLLDEMVGDVSFAIEFAERDAERKRVEEALRASEEKYRSLVESSDSVIAMFDGDGTVLYGNEIAARSLNLTPETIIGKSMHELFPPAVATYQLNSIKRAIQTGVGSVAESLSAIAEGRRWYRTSVQPVLDASGKGVAATINAVDITAIKEVEEALREAYDTLEKRVVERTAELQAAKDRLEAILNNSPSGILLLDLELRIRQANVAFSRLFASESPGHFGQSLLTYIHPDDRGRVEALVDTPAVAPVGSHIEVRGIRPDGTTFDAELSIGYIHEDGAVCIVQDITVRKAQEQQLRYHASVQSSMNDAVIVTDLEFHIQSWNRAAQLIYGWREDEVRGQSVLDLLETQYDESSGQRAQIREQYARAGHWAGEVIQKHKDGSPIFVRSSVTTIRDEQGHPYGMVAVNSDITERKAAEHSLHTYAAEIHDLYNNAPCGYHSLNEDGVFVQINDTELQWLGYSRDEVLNKLSFRDIVTPESRKEFEASFPLFKKRGWITDQEFDLVRKDGSTLHVLISATAITDDNGRYVMSRTTLFDITELKRAQEAIRENELRYRLLADNVTDVVLRADLAGNYVYISPSCTAVMGYTPDELLGRKTLDFVHPDDLGIAAKAVQRALTAGDPEFRINVRFHHRAGHYVWLETVGQMIYAQHSGEPEGYVASAREVTARKQAEDALRESEGRFRSVIDAATDYILLLNRGGKVRMANPTALRDLGYEEDQVVGQLVTAFFLPDSQAAFGAEFPHLLETGTLRSEKRLLRKDGSAADMDCSWSVAYDEARQPQSVVVVMRDIAERKRAEEALRQALEKERELGDLKSRFVSMASHEFRTPLATILALTEMLITYRHQLADEHIAHRLDNIKEQVGHLTDIMEDVLQLARMQARRVEFNPAPVDLDALCRSIIDEYQSQPPVQHHVSYTCNPALRHVVLDRKLMRQIIGNLISNAIKYSPEKHAVVVTLDYVDEALVLSVRDEGIGIPAADLKHLFEPFHRGSNVGTIAGTGLGLNIVKESVDLHSGDIRVTSDTGGTTFTVTIPVAIQGESDAKDSGH
ncbi:PAS domain S-box protein [Aggregatilinea lenta]|uniref:PAS domain S-box protein n=1 Tax=Aggregatilinea lenta TaxID=913108 RepID=UPI000E5B1D16|nr:PAS domain S-box protein [Aggregatilinea lenta]